MTDKKNEGRGVDQGPAMAVGTGAGLSRRTLLGRAGAMALGATSLSAALAACGDSDGKSSSNTAPAAKARDYSKVVGAATLLTLRAAGTPAFVGNNDMGKAWAAAVPGRTFKMTALPYASYVAGVTTRARSGNLPDIVELIPGTNQEKIWPALKTFKRSDFGDLADQLVGWELTLKDPDNPDEVLGIPVSGQGHIWYYNKKLFEQVGLDPEAPPTTDDELAQAAAKLKAAGITPIEFGGADNYNVAWAVSTYLVQLLSPEDNQAFVRGELAVNDDKIKRAIAPLERMAREGWVNPNMKDTNFGDAQTAFTSGKAAMMSGLVGGTANWGAFDATSIKNDYAPFLMPPPEGAEQRVSFSLDVFQGISRDAKDPDAAMSLLQFIGSEAGQRINLLKGGQFPNRKGMDVSEITPSRGAAAVSKLVDSTPQSFNPFYYLNTDATTLYFKQLGVAVLEGTTAKLLDQMADLQAS